MGGPSWSDREAAIAIYHYRKGLARGAALAVVHPDFGVNPQAVDKTGQVTRSSWPAALIEQCDKFGRAFASLARQLGIVPARSPDVSKHEVVQRLDTVLQGNHHQIAPSNDADAAAPASEEMRIARTVFAHRLSENRK